MQVNGKRTHSQGDGGPGQWMVHPTGDHSDGEQVTVALDHMTVSHDTLDKQKCHLHPSPGKPSEVRLHKSLTLGQEQGFVQGQWRICYPRK